MKRRVRVTLPKAEEGAQVKPGGARAGLGFNWNQFPWPAMAGKMSVPDVSVKSTLQPVDRNKANLEAEKGEVAMLPTKGGIPSTFKISGKRHHSGGTPLNLPANSFIFSDTAKMRIKDPMILAQFGIFTKGSYTPAEIAKKYDINPYKKILADPDTDDLQRSTAEMMITNFNMKLSKLALVQESMKGFEQGIPAIAIPYIEAQEIDPATLVHENPQAEQPGPDDSEMSRYGGAMQARKGMQVKPKRKVKIMMPSNTAPKYKDGGVNIPEKYQKSYDLLVKTLSDPEVQDAVYQDYLKESERIKNPELKRKALDAPKEKVLSNLLQMQKQNYALHAAGIDLKTDSEVWDKSSVKDKTGRRWAKNEKYKTTMEGLGFKPNEILSSDDDITIAQAAYNSALRTSTSDKYKDKFGKNFVPLKGKADEKYDPSKPDLSAPDSFYGNTTAGQLLKYQTPEEAKKEAEVIKEKEKAPDVYTPTVAEHLPAQPAQDFGAPWWLQDQVKIGHAARNLAGIKKYFPWQATPAVFTPSVTFEDPARALAANAEQSNIAANTLAQFTGPQSFNARFNQIQGQGFKNAADVLAQVHNRNIGISNMQASQNANIMNRASENRANMATTLWDKYQATNQNFDAAKSQARDALVSAYVQGQTNRANTYNMNTLFPQFAVNPANAGMVYNKAGRDFKPSFAKPKTFTETYNDLLRENPTLKDKPDKAADIALKIMGLQPQTELDAYTEYGKKKGLIPGYQDQSDS